jgi:hypothetical protein
MKYVVLFFALIMAHATAQAQSVETFRPIIEQQLQAMAKDDNAGAWNQAAPSIQMLFPTPDDFMFMVRSQYPMVYRYKGYTFLEAGTDPSGRLFQHLRIQGEDGTFYDAIYFMQQQPDGSWKISGCVIAKTKGGEA